MNKMATPYLILDSWLYPKENFNDNTDHLYKLKLSIKKYVISLIYLVCQKTWRIKIGGIILNFKVLKN
jgi:hypothetical protein